MTSTSYRAVLLSEWTKIRSLRSTVWALALLVVLTIGFSALFTALTVSQWSKADPTERAIILGDPTARILGGGLALSQLAVCVLGVLIIAGEYSSGTIRTSLLAVPSRTPVLSAKAVVFSLLVFVVGEIAVFPSFFIGAALLHSRVQVSIADPGVLRAVLGAGLYLGMLGVFALAIGALVRHAAGGITGIIGFVLVLAPLASLLPGSIGRHVHAFLPSEAGQLIAFSHHAPGALLSPWQGYGVFALWTAALMAAAAILLKRRDA
jgi:ABC-2 type transport system permease protein